MRSRESVTSCICTAPGEFPPVNGSYDPPQNHPETLVDLHCRSYHRTRSGMRWAVRLVERVNDDYRNPQRPVPLHMMHCW